MSDFSAVVSKGWNYALVRKNAGVGYGDTIEQLTCLPILKLANDMSEMVFENTVPPVDASYALSRRPSDQLESEFVRKITRPNRLPQSTLASAFRGVLS